MTGRGMSEDLQDDTHDGGTTDHSAGGIDVVLVTGLSGAGRGTAAKVLEDLGWYVADNLPPELITRMVELGLAAGSRITRLALVMDVRSRGFTGDVEWVRNDLATRDITPAGVVPRGVGRHSGPTIRAEPSKPSTSGESDAGRRYFG